MSWTVEGNSWTFRLDGIVPVPAARPRVTKHGTFTPYAYRRYLEHMRSAMGQTDDEVRLSPVRVDIVLRLPRPQRPAKYATVGGQRVSTREACISRYDVDNLAKAVLDAMQPRVIADDRLVVALKAEKRWADDRPGVTVTVTPT